MFFFFMIIISTTVRKFAHAQTKYLGGRITKTKNPVPVCRTSRRGARTAYHDEYPRDFGPRIAYTQTPVGPQSGREGEKCLPLDHMRHTPFIKQLCSHPTLRINSTYIQNGPNCFFHVVFTLCLKTL